MKLVPTKQPRRTKAAIAAWTLVIAAASLLVWPADESSHAQQDRQLQQTGSANANAAKRIALVIGNGTYTNAPVLKNPPNDARDIAATLKTLGFEVTSGINVNQKEMKRLVREFGQKLKTGGSGLFYYAGHGVQSKGRNFLIPVDADIQSEAEVEDSAVDIGLVLNYMDDAQNGLNIVILDACRNNPFGRSFRSASGGLAQVDAPTGTLIAYATAPGRVASDGQGQNGLYTSELLKQMRVPGLSVTDMFMHVRAEVMKQTAGKQVPWEASSLVGNFYFGSSRTNSDIELKSLEGAGASPAPTSANLAACFASDPAAGSTDWNSHYSWAQNQTLAKLKTAIQQKLDFIFRCPSVTDEQTFDDFAAISVMIARYVPNAACFHGDEGVVSADPSGHQKWARERGRKVALDNLKSKATVALDCLDGSRRASYYADVSVLAAGGALK